ncbi:MAG: hypothetical protein JKY09_07460 [Crocinitomicaceae bacterium]|nr:hypothetical protein [Crocinitomicaceae bacterium]
MKKQIVHIVNVVRNAEKIQFQIKLPLDTKRITGLKITGMPQVRNYERKERNPMPIANEIGWLWLRIPEQRDVFYAESVKRVLPLHNLTITNHRPLDDFGNGTYWTQGKKEEFFTVNVDVTTNLVEGFYMDRITTDQEKYTLKIYLTLEI